MPQSHSQGSHGLSQPEPSHRKRPHETAPPRYSKHQHKATAIAPIRQKKYNCSSRPNCGQRNLDRRYLRAIIPCRTDRSRPFGHRRRRRQLFRKYFCFAAFADKRTGVLYNDLTGSFPYMSLEGNVCYLITYHYESNAILGLPISGFDDKTVFAAYKAQFELLESKGYKIKLCVMDNQCTKQINKFLTQTIVNSCSSNRTISHERGQTRNTDVQGSLYQRPSDD